MLSNINNIMVIDSMQTIYSYDAQINESNRVLEGYNFVPDHSSVQSLMGCKEDTTVMIRRDVAMHNAHRKEILNNLGEYSGVLARLALREAQKPEDRSFSIYITNKMNIFDPSLALVFPDIVEGIWAGNLIDYSDKFQELKHLQLPKGHPMVIILLKGSTPTMELISWEVFEKNPQSILDDIAQKRSSAMRSCQFNLHTRYDSITKAFHTALGHTDYYLSEGKIFRSIRTGQTTFDERYICEAIECQETVLNNPESIKDFLIRKEQEVYH